MLWYECCCKVCKSDKDISALNSSNIRSFVRNCIYSGNKPYGIHNGIDGLINDEVRPIQWSDVTGWVVEVLAL